MGSNPTRSAKRQFSCGFCRLRTGFLLDRGQRTFQSVHHCIRRGKLGIVVQVGIYVGGGREVTVSKPFLDLLHGNAVGKKQRCAAMPEIMEPDMPQAVLFKQSRKGFGKILMSAAFNSRA